MHVTGTQPSINAGKPANQENRIFAFCCAVAIFFITQVLIDAQGFRGDARLYWALSSDLLDLNFPQSIRGYLYPLLLTPFRFVFNHSEQGGLLALKAGQAVVYSYLFTIVLPDLYHKIFGGSLSTFRRALPAVLIAIIFPGLISYPLSDAPAFGMIVCALAISINASRSQGISRSIALFLFAGLLTYAAYNTRTIYFSRSSPWHWRYHFSSPGTAYGKSLQCAHFQWALCLVPFLRWRSTISTTTAGRPWL